MNDEDRIADMYTSIDANHYADYFSWYYAGIFADYTSDDLFAGNIGESVATETMNVETDDIKAIS